MNNRNKQLSYAFNMSDERTIAYVFGRTDLFRSHKRSQDHITGVHIVFKEIEARNE